MWKKKHITFLTQNHIDKDRIITVLEQYTSNSKDDQDKKILTGILKNFKNNDFSLLNTQEIQYLMKNSEQKWGTNSTITRITTFYLIFQSICF